MRKFFNLSLFIFLSMGTSITSFEEAGAMTEPENAVTPCLPITCLCWCVLVCGNTVVPQHHNLCVSACLLGCAFPG